MRRGCSVGLQRYCLFGLLDRFLKATVRNKMIHETSVQGNRSGLQFESAIHQFQRFTGSAPHPEKLRIKMLSLRGGRIELARASEFSLGPIPIPLGKNFVPA